MLNESTMQQIEELYSFNCAEALILRENIERPGRLSPCDRFGDKFTTGLPNKFGGFRLNSLPPSFYALYLASVSGKSRDIKPLLTTNSFTGDDISNILNFATWGRKSLIKTKIKTKFGSQKGPDIEFHGLHPDVAVILYPISSKRADVIDFGYPAISRLVADGLVDPNYFSPHSSDEDLFSIIALKIKSLTLAVKLFEHGYESRKDDIDFLSSQDCDWQIIKLIFNSGAPLDDRSACAMWNPLYTKEADFERVFFSRIDNPSVVRGTVLAHNDVAVAYEMLVPAYISKDEFFKAGNGFEGRDRAKIDAFRVHLEILDVTNKDDTQETGRTSIIRRRASI